MSMLNSWFGSKSSRHSQPRRRPPNQQPALDDAQPGYSDASSVTPSTLEPLQTPGLTSASDVPLDEVHAHINDPSVYPPTPSLGHSAEKVSATLRTSDALTLSPNDSTHPRDGVQRVFEPERPGEDALFTPQDAIIAQVFGKSVPAQDSAHVTPPPSSNAAQPSVSLTSDSVPQPPSSSMQTRARLGPTLPIYDPFLGARLGERTPVSPSATVLAELFSPASPPTNDDHKLWSSLERILELQAEIAAMHADMEGVGGRASVSTHTGGMSGVGTSEGGNAVRRKGSKRGQTLLVGDEEAEEQEPEARASTGAAISELSTDHSDGEEEDEDEEDEDDIHGYGKKRRDEEFARLAEQFTQRKVAIGGIMNKLDDLSVALKTFHALPAPLFDIPVTPSRTDTSPTPSNVSTASPTHVYFGQPSSPLLSISPSQAVSSVTPPPVSLSPPVPPISTLAPPVSPAESSGRPGLVSIVAPVLPRALPKIIPGALHVESPADMDPRQSILQGMK